MTFTTSSDTSHETALSVLKHLASGSWPADLLLEHPESGRMVPERRDPLIREIIFRPYRIDYERRLVEIARVWHAARGTPELPEP